MRHTANASGGASHAAPRLLEARKNRVAFDAMVGKTHVVQQGVGSAAQAGFYCSLCDKICKDNVAYLDHLNSPLHLRLTGQKMEVRRSSLADVLARIEFHRRRLHCDTKEYSLDERVAEARRREEDAKRLRKERRRRGPAESSQRHSESAAGGAEPQGNDDQEEESEYSDYDIDEYGNIIEKPPGDVKERALHSKPRKSDDEGSDNDEEIQESMILQVLGFAGFESTK